MSTLVLVLATAMTVPGIGPEKVSGEVKQGLDLRGAWEGVWEPGDGTIWQAELEGGRFTATRGNGPQIEFTVWEQHVTDEGKGRVRIEVGWHIHLGIYEQQNNCLVVCYGKHGQARPASFRGGGGQHLLSLRRVKPRK